MEIRDQRSRHGIADPDIHHAIDNAVTAGPVKTNVDQIDGALYIGPDRTGRHAGGKSRLTMSMTAKSPSMR